MTHPLGALIWPLTLLYMTASIALAQPALGDEPALAVPAFELGTAPDRGFNPQPASAPPPPADPARPTLKPSDDRATEPAISPSPLTRVTSAGTLPMLDPETAGRLRELLVAPRAGAEPTLDRDRRTIGWSGWERRGGALDLGPDLHLQGSQSEFYLSGAGASVGEARDGRTPAQLVDVSATWDALRLGELALSLSGGVRVAMTGPTLDQEPGVTYITPVVGPGVGWQQARWAQARGMFLSDPGGSRGDYLELRVEQVLRLSQRATLSVGYQKVSNLFGSTNQRAQGREAVLLEFRVGF